MSGMEIHSEIVKDVGFQYQFSAKRGHLRMFKLGDEQTGFWFTGEYISGGGIVSVYRQEGYTRLDFATVGRCFSRGWQKSYGDRTISRLAREFIADMANVA